MTETPASAAGASPRAMFFGSAAAAPMLRGPTVTLAPEDGSGGGGWSIAEATAHLNNLPDEDEGGDQAAAPAADAGAADTGAADAGAETQSEGAASSPDDEAAGAAEHQPDGDTQTEGAQPAAVAPQEAPKYWSQDAKVRFRELAPELQAVVLAQEGPREEAAAKAKAEAATQRAAADSEIAAVRQLSEGLNRFLPQAVETFKGRWGDKAPDWVAFGKQHGAEAMTFAKAQYESEVAQLNEVSRAQQQAQEMSLRAYFQEQHEALKTIDPELADPAEGPARRTEVTRYLQGITLTGKDGKAVRAIPDEQLRNISAAEISLARKAMLWDQLQAKAKSAPTPPAKPAPASAPLTRGGASAGQVDPKAKQVQTAQQRFSKSRSIADATAYLNSLDN